MTEQTLSTTPRLIRACLFWGILVATVYVGAYLFFAQSDFAFRFGRMRSVPKYSDWRSAQRCLEIVFWPIYQVDYHLRPGLWQVEFSDEPLQFESGGIR